MYNSPIVAEDFSVPTSLETTRLRLRPLSISDVVKDYDAVMTSEDRLRTIFNPGGEWPHGLTLEQDIIELGWHQTEFQLRTSFTYTVVSLDESSVLGCMYIYPASHPQFDAQVTMWVRQSEAETGLDDHLFETVQDWIDRHWPFERPGYPGRNISWEEFRSGSG